MGKCKALLPLGGTTFLEMLISNLEKVPLEKIVVVLGYHQTEILEKTGLRPGSYIINENPEEGQLSSINAAVKLAGPDWTGIMVVLVDQPAVHLSTYRRLKECFSSNPESIILPVYNGRRGHPVIFPKRFFPDLLKAPADLGARYVVRKYWDQVVEVPVPDEMILKDIDTPEDYANSAGTQCASP